MNQSALERGRHVKLGLLQRHPQAFLCLSSKSTELQQQKQMLEREEATPVPPRRQREAVSFVRIMRDDRLEQAVTVGRGSPSSGVWVRS